MRVAGAVYGLIAVGALLAAEQGAHDTYGETVAALGLTLTLYWLAHGYAQYVSNRLREAKGLTLPDLARTLVRELPILTGGTIPLFVVVICWAGDVRLTSGIAAGIWTTIAVIVLLEIGAGVRARLGLGELLVQSALGSILGLLVVALKLLLQ